MIYHFICFFSEKTSNMDIIMNDDRFYNHMPNELRAMYQEKERNLRTINGHMAKKVHIFWIRKWLICKK